MHLFELVFLLIPFFATDHKYCLVIYQVSIYVWIYLWLPYSLLLIYVIIHMPLRSHCLLTTSDCQQQRPVLAPDMALLTEDTNQKRTGYLIMLQSFYTICLLTLTFHRCQTCRTIWKLLLITSSLSLLYFTGVFSNETLAWSNLVLMLLASQMSWTETYVLSERICLYFSQVSEISTIGAILLY